MTKGERAEKIRLLNYYEGDKCVCGAKKPVRHWSCTDCKKGMKGTVEAQFLTDACSLHVTAGGNYIKAIMGRKGIHDRRRS